MDIVCLRNISINTLHKGDDDDDDDDNNNKHNSSLVIPCCGQGTRNGWDVLSCRTGGIPILLCRQRHRVPLKCWCLCSKVCGVTSQKTVSILYSHGDNLDFAEVKDFHSFVFSMYLKSLLKDFSNRRGSANKYVKQKRMSVKSRYSVGILN